MNTKDILKCVLFTPGAKGRWGLPVVFEGPPGTGKTQQIETYSAEFGLACEVIIGSIREPTDVGGLARLEDDRFRLVPAAWALALAAKKRGVLYLDELTTNVPAMQAAMLRLLTDGAVGEFMLPPSIRFLAAQNRVEEAAGGWDLTPPLANRLGHLAWESPSVSAWTQWMLGASDSARPFDAAELEAQVLKVWPEAFAKAKGLVTGFLRTKPDLLHKMPAAGSPDLSRAWPSHRTWELATRAAASSEVHELDAADAEELVSAFVGAGAAAELLTYQKHADLPDPVDVLEGRVQFKHDPRRLDRTAATLGACAALVAPKDAPNRKARADVLWTILGEVVKDNADICVQPGVVISRAGLTSGTAAHKALVRIHPVLQAAGFKADAA